MYCGKNMAHLCIVFNSSFDNTTLFRCPNLAVKEAEDDENIEEDVPVEKAKKVSHAKRKKQSQCKLTWIGEAVQVFVFSIILCCYNEVFLSCMRTCV